MRVLVCGSRHFNDHKLLIEELDKHEITTIISGEARGADLMAKSYALSKGIDYEGYPADWNAYGKGAGPIRNLQMLVEGKPDLVIAYLAPDSRGTRNMIDQAEKAGIPVKVVDVA